MAISQENISALVADQKAWKEKKDEKARQQRDEAIALQKAEKAAQVSAEQEKKFEKEEKQAKLKEAFKENKRRERKEKAAKHVIFLAVTSVVFGGLFMAANQGINPKPPSKAERFRAASQEKGRKKAAPESTKGPVHAIMNVGQPVGLLNCSTTKNVSGMNPNKVRYMHVKANTRVLVHGRAKGEPEGFVKVTIPIGYPIDPKSPHPTCSGSLSGLALSAPGKDQKKIYEMMYGEGGTPPPLSKEKTTHYQYTPHPQPK